MSQGLLTAAMAGSEAEMAPGLREAVSYLRGCQGIELSGDCPRFGAERQLRVT